jgi:hypothetical protein
MKEDKRNLPLRGFRKSNFSLYGAGQPSFKGPGLHFFWLDAEQPAPSPTVRRSGAPDLPHPNQSTTPRLIKPIPFKPVVALFLDPH